MMKIYLKAFIDKNLGDDLFIDIITKRYPNEKFLIDDRAEYLNNENLIFYKKSKISKLLGKILYTCSFSKINYETFISKKCDLSVMIGGSMFIEGSSKYIEKLQKPLFIIGSNFGPYSTKKFLKNNKKILSSAYDVCFRDKESFDLFKDLNNVRYSTDIVFSYKNSDIKISKDKKVVISVIDCDFKAKELGNNYREDYEKKIVEFIEFFNSKNYEVTLMSFCKAQGDEIAINRIMKKTSVKVSKFYYTGNIEKAVEVIASSSIVIGTRFHANILGLLYNKTIIPISYSNKTTNILKNLKFKGKILNIKDIKKFNVFSLSDEELKYKIDIHNQIIQANSHFEKLDRYLNQRGIKNE